MRKLHNYYEPSPWNSLSAYAWLFGPMPLEVLIGRPAAPRAPKPRQAFAQSMRSVNRNR
ncbi:MAG TPA: hypothetical protein VF598_00260 [Hymenobacter sp.]|jgi:hypothetical protein